MNDEQLAEIARLRDEIAKLRDEIAQLRDEIAQLRRAQNRYYVTDGRGHLWASVESDKA